MSPIGTIGILGIGDMDQYGCWDGKGVTQTPFVPYTLGHRIGYGRYRSIITRDTIYGIGSLGNCPRVMIHRMKIKSAKPSMICMVRKA